MRTSLNDNRTVVALDKVGYAKFFYSSHRGSSTQTKPTVPTVNGQTFDTTQQRISTSIETMLDYAKRKNLLDMWEPVCILQMSNNHSLRYTGEKAISIWKAWCSKQFKKKEEK